MDKPIRIQAEDGSVVDLAIYRAGLVRKGAYKDVSCELIVLNALVAALNVLYTQDEDRSSDPVLDEGYDIAIGHVRQAARVVEE